MGSRGAISDLEAHVEQLQLMLREAHRERDDYASQADELEQLRKCMKQAERDCEVARRDARQLVIERDNANADAEALLERVRALAVENGDDDNDGGSPLARMQTAVPGSAMRGGARGGVVSSERDDDDDLRTPMRGQTRTVSLDAMLGVAESPSGELESDDVVDGALALSSRRSSQAEALTDQQQQTEAVPTADAQTAADETAEPLTDQQQQTEAAPTADAQTAADETAEAADEPSRSCCAELERSHRQEVTALRQQIAALQAQLGLSAAAHAAAAVHRSGSFDEVEVSHSPLVSRLSNESEGGAAEADDGSLRKLGSHTETAEEQLARLLEVNAKMLVEKRNAEENARMLQGRLQECHSDLRELGTTLQATRQRLIAAEAKLQPS